MYDYSYAPPYRSNHSKKGGENAYEFPTVYWYNSYLRASGQVFASLSVNELCHPAAGVSQPAVFLLTVREKSSLTAFIDMNDTGTTMTTLSSLTPRELEILRLILAGHTNKAIAAEIYISEKTVEFHLDNLYSKIGVRTRMLAGIWALQQGMLVEAKEIPAQTKGF
jgi:DNA-binding CsgD family transcriptional regulator